MPRFRNTGSIAQKAPQASPLSECNLSTQPAAPAAPLFLDLRRSRHRNPQRHRRCRPLSEANTTCRHRAAITLGTKSRQPSHRRLPSLPFEPLCREWYNTCILSCKVIILCMVNIMQNPYRRREVYFLEKVLTAHSRKIRKRSVEFVCLLKQGKSVLSVQAM